MIALAPIILITWPPVPLARTAPAEPPMSAVSHYCSSFYQILRDCHFSSISTAALKAENKRRGIYALGIYLNCPIFLPHSNTTLLRIYIYMDCISYFRLSFATLRLSLLMFILLCVCIGSWCNYHWSILEFILLFLRLFNYFSRDAWFSSKKKKQNSWRAAQLLTFYVAFMVKDTVRPNS